MSSTELDKLRQAHAEVQSQARADREVLQKVRQIAAVSRFCFNVFSAARGSSSSPSCGDPQRSSRIFRGAQRPPAALLLVDCVGISSKRRG